MGFARPGCKITSGSIVFDGIDLMKAPEAEKCKLRSSRIAYVAQSAVASFNPSHKLFDQTVGATVRHGVNDEPQAKSDARSLFADLQLPDPDKIGNRYPHQVSGGQKQLVCIARSIAAEPEFIICDEVTSALDQIVQKGILSLLLRLQKELGITYMFITHDITTVKAITDQIVVMFQGGVVEQRMNSETLSPPFPDYTKLLLSSVPEMDPDWLSGLLKERSKEQTTV